MEFKPVSISSIETAILSFVRQHVAEIEGEPLTMFDARKNLDTINKFPAIAVATDLIDFKSKSSAIGWTPRVVVYLVFKNVSNEAHRREGVYPLVEGVSMLLAWQTLGLEIDRLEPLTATEIMNQSFTTRGLLGFQIAFKTNFDVDPIDMRAEAVRLLSIGIRYYMQHVDDGEHDASDIVNLEG